LFSVKQDPTAFSSDNSDQRKIDMVNLEFGLVHIDAPDAEIEMTLKSLHDSSYINCKKLTIYLDEKFF